MSLEISSENMWWHKDNLFFFFFFEGRTIVDKYIYIIVSNTHQIKFSYKYQIEIEFFYIRN